jgi:hypothetical protein
VSRLVYGGGAKHGLHRPAGLIAYFPGDFRIRANTVALSRVFSSDVILGPGFPESRSTQTRPSCARTYAGEVNKSEVCPITKSCWTYAPVRACATSADLGARRFDGRMLCRLGTANAVSVEAVTHMFVWSAVCFCVAVSAAMASSWLFFNIRNEINIASPADQQIGALWGYPGKLQDVVSRHRILYPNSGIRRALWITIVAGALSLISAVAPLWLSAPINP